VYQAGTLSGNPLATAAGLAVLSEVTEKDYTELGARVAGFAAQLSSAISDGGLAVTVPVVGPLVGLFLAPAPGGNGPTEQLLAPVDFVAAHQLASNGVYPRFFHAMLQRGIALAPGAYEVMFPGLAHTDEVLASVVSAAGDAATQVAKDLLSAGD
jgi:glutamate-1-semialdehyde 2,1-aminomutase